MVAKTLKPALRLALRLHEIGDASPYQLFFAGKGKSGASFGFMQGDLAAGQPEVKQTFHDALAAAGVSASRIDSITKKLSVHVVTNPLSPADTKLANQALAASKKLVDDMDEEIAQKVYDSLDQCIKAATKSARTIEPKALIYMALWINMTGPPTSLIKWLSGGNPGFAKPVPKAGANVDGAAMETYLRATHYYTENPGNLPHMLSSAAAGAAILP